MGNLFSSLSCCNDNIPISYSSDSDSFSTPNPPSPQIIDDPEEFLNYYR
jgi:hypothetical protein